MNPYSRGAAVVVLALALLLSPLASARPVDRDSSSGIVRIVKKIQRLFGIATNDDMPQPPIPKTGAPTNG